MADGAPARRVPTFIRVSAGLHLASLALWVANPAWWRVALSAVTMNHVTLGVAGMLPRCGWLGANVTRLPAHPANDGLVALTFDDGPDPAVTPVVLDLLERAGARATFFCIGSRAERHPDLVRAIRERGHGVENHTYSHPNNFALRGPSGMAAQIVRAQQAIERSGGGSPSLFRAPAGMQNPWLGSVLAGTGHRLVSWTRRGYDTVTPSSARVADRLARGLRAGDILLLHDGSSARDRDGRAVVLDALERTIERLSAAGLRSEALHRLLDTGAHSAARG